MLVANPTARKLTIAANKDRYAKLTREYTMAADFRRIFRSMGNDFEAIYSQTGYAPSMDHFEPEISGKLSEHYRKVASSFKDNIRQSLDPDLNARYHAPVVAQAVDHAIVTKIQALAPKQTNAILKTTKDQMNAALVNAHIEAANVNRPGDKQFVATYMRKWFGANGIARSQTIATTEVNSVAEFSKHAEATTLQTFTPKKAVFVVMEGKARVVLAPAIRGNSGKTWVAALDEKTRPWHAEADFKNVATGEFFIVHGEKLLYPGDADNGASLDNLINCRCAAIYYISSVPIIGGVVAAPPPSAEDRARTEDDLR